MKKLLARLAWVKEECPTCRGRGTSWDESTGGRCWDCRGRGWVPLRRFQRLARRISWTEAAW